MQILNSCYAFINTIGAEKISLIYYSHLIPIAFVLFLSILVYLKTSRNILSKIFLAFSIIFSILLTADLLTWVSSNYFLISASWAPIDYFETALYLLGLYFVIVFIKKEDISRILKVILFLVSLFPLVITFMGNSVLSFNIPMCEAVNNNLLLTYRFVIQIIVLVSILITILWFYFKKFKINPVFNKRAYFAVLGSLFLFLSIFGISSYLSAFTGIYEIHLYSLFVTPVFLMFMTYSIFSLDIFNIRIISTYFIVFGLIIVIGSQLFFVEGNINKSLTMVTLAISIALIYLLFKNLKKESDQRLRIEKLSVDLEQSNLKLENANEKLKGLDKLKTEFVSLASHQLRSPLTAIKGYSSMLSDGDYGKLSKKAQDAIERIFQSSKNLTIIVEDLLNVTKIEAGGMKYEMIQFDLNQLVKDEVKDFLMITEKKGLKLNFEENNELYMVYGDKEKIRQIIINLVDNSIKYTKEGSISISVKNKDNKIIFSVKDTGMGMTEEIKESLFHKFARGEGARMNTTGSGLGLYLAKQIVIAHKGRIWVESEGMGKGSTFFMELDQVK